MSGLPESLLVSGTIGAVAISAAVVSGPSIVNRADAQPMPTYSVPLMMFAPPVPRVVTPDAVPPGVPVPSTSIPSVVQPPPPVSVRAPAATTAPVIVVPSTTTTTTTEPPTTTTTEPCTIGLILDPILGVCVSI